MSARARCSCGWTGGPYSSRARAQAMAAKHVCQNPGVRRATRRHRCARCGLEAVYENAGAAEARYWFSKHSCTKHEQATLRSNLHADRLALIDRTPKPCHHKQANHQHGTNAAYVLDKCRCEPCSAARSAQDDTRRRLKAYGRYHKYVPAGPVREHVHALMNAGLGLKTVSKRTGVSTGTLSKLIYGVYAVTGSGGGRAGAGELIRPPSRRVLRETAEKLYELNADWSGPLRLAPGSPDPDRTPAARTHLRALVALGWSMSELGRRLGMNHPSNVTPLFHGRVMQARTVDTAELLFEQLCMTPPPERDPRQKAAAARARRYAAARGWLPPLALEDLESDPDPDRESELNLAGELEVNHDVDEDVDEVAIQRRMSGDKAVRLTQHETIELARRWRVSGRPLNECERITGINPHRTLRPLGEAS
jgi:hypothetical protein